MLQPLFWGFSFFMKLLEYWQDCPKFPNYEVSYSQKVRHRIIKKEKSWYMKDGYKILNINFRGRKHHAGVHQMVGWTFIPNPENKPELNHIDGNKLNNHPSNFEWVTQAENREHAFRIGLKKSAPKPTKEQRDFILEFSKTLGMCEVARRLNLPLYVVVRVAGKTNAIHSKPVIDLNTGIFWTTDEVAAMLGIERRYVHRILSEERKPNTTQYRYA